MKRPTFFGLAIFGADSGLKSELEAETAGQPTFGGVPGSESFDHLERLDAAEGPGFLGRLGMCQRWAAARKKGAPSAHCPLDGPIWLKQLGCFKLWTCWNAHTVQKMRWKVRSATQHAAFSPMSFEGPLMLCKCEPQLPLNVQLMSRKVAVSRTLEVSWGHWTLDPQEVMEAQPKTIWVGKMGSHVGDRFNTG